MGEQVPTIEWVAEQLGEPHAHLAPYQTNVGSYPDDMRRAVWWAVFGWSEDAARRVTTKPILWTDAHGNDQALAGPTREQALLEAAKAIRAGRFKQPEPSASDIAWAGAVEKVAALVEEYRPPVARPSIYLTNWSSTGMHGRGRLLTIMAAPRSWEHGVGCVPTLTPELADLRALQHGELTLASYRERLERKISGDIVGLKPGNLDAYLPHLSGARSSVQDGDTLCCSCSREAASKGECHRVWAAHALVKAGWRVVLDGVDLTAEPEPELFGAKGGTDGR